MAIPFATSGQLGIDLSAVYVPSTSLYPYATNNQQFALGQQVTAQDNSVWVYVKYGTGGSTGLGFVMVYDEDFTALMVDNSTGALGDKIGICPSSVAVAAGSYGWLQIFGTCDAIQVLASCNPNVQLATTTTAGALDDTVSSPTINVNGIVLTAARTSSQGNAPGVLNYPVIGTANV